MAHPAQTNFCKLIKNKFKDHFENKRVLDCGSLDINGNNKFLFDNCEYIGIDVWEGNNVDVVTTIHEYNEPDESFDTIISTECFEHDKYYKQSLKNIVRLLKPGGLFLFTCATHGRIEHGTVRTSPMNSATSNIEGWENYYKNLSQKDIEEVINVKDIFVEYQFKLNSSPHDLYFWGIKK